MTRLIEPPPPSPAADYETTAGTTTPVGAAGGLGATTQFLYECSPSA